MLGVNFTKMMIILFCILKSKRTRSYTIQLLPVEEDFNRDLAKTNAITNYRFVVVLTLYKLAYQHIMMKVLEDIFEAKNNDLREYQAQPSKYFDQHKILIYETFASKMKMSFFNVLPKDFITVSISFEEFSKSIFFQSFIKSKVVSNQNTCVVLICIYIQKIAFYVINNFYNLNIKLFNSIYRLYEYFNCTVKNLENENSEALVCICDIENIVNTNFIPCIKDTILFIDFTSFIFSNMHNILSQNLKPHLEEQTEQRNSVCINEENAEKIVRPLIVELIKKLNTLIEISNKNTLAYFEDHNLYYYIQNNYNIENNERNNCKNCLLIFLKSLCAQIGITPELNQLHLSCQQYYGNNLSIYHIIKSKYIAKCYNCFKIIRSLCSVDKNTCLPFLQKLSRMNIGKLIKESSAGFNQLCDFIFDINADMEEDLYFFDLFAGLENEDLDCLNSNDANVIGNFFLQLYFVLLDLKCRRLYNFIVCSLSGPLNYNDAAIFEKNEKLLSAYISEKSAISNFDGDIFIKKCNYAFKEKQNFISVKT